MPSLEYPPQEVPLTTDPDGTIRVRGTRVLFDLIVRAYWNGASPEDIVRMYDTLDTSDVYLVIGFYLKNRIPCDAYLREGEVRGAEIRARWEALKPFPPNFKEVLLQRQRAIHDVSPG